MLRAPISTAAPVFQRKQAPPRCAENSLGQPPSGINGTGPSDGPPAFMSVPGLGCGAGEGGGAGVGKGAGVGGGVGVVLGVVGSGVVLVVVPPGVPPPWPTVTLAVIWGCISQWYATVPVSSNVNVKESPGCNVPESNDPSSAVTVCAVLPSLVHRTVVPGWMVTWAGSKRKSRIETVCWLP